MSPESWSRWKALDGVGAAALVTAVRICFIVSDELFLDRIEGHLATEFPACRGSETCKMAIPGHCGVTTRLLSRLHAIHKVPDVINRVSSGHFLVVSALEKFIVADSENFKIARFDPAFITFKLDWTRTKTRSPFALVFESRSAE